jgi:teichuronic acid exporter
VRSALPWAIGEGFLSALATFLTTLVAARLVLPEEFGQASIAIAIPAIVQALLLTGPTTALTRAHHVDGRLADSMFWSFILLGVLGWALCAALAFPVAAFYGHPELAALLVVGGFGCVLQGIASCPTAVLTRKLRTRALATRTLWQKIVTFAVTAAAAFYGLNAWAIVLGVTCGLAAAAVILLASQPRLPRLRFSWFAAAPVLKLGSLVSVEAFAGGTTPRAILLIFGWFQGVEALGLLNFGIRLVDELANVASMALSRIALPIFAALRRQGMEVRPAFMTGTRLIIGVTAPALIGLAVILPDVIPLVFGERWTPAVFAAQVMAFTWALRFSRVLAPAVLLSAGKQAPQILNSWIALFVGVIGTALLSQGPFELAVWSYAVPALTTMPIGIMLLARHSNSIGVFDQISVMRPFLLAVLMFAALEVTRHTALAATAAPLRAALLVLIGMAIYGLLFVVVERRTLQVARAHLGGRT